MTSETASNPACNYDPLYVAYLIYFNRDRDYFECHEVLEELWLACGSDPLYKGLLQVAVGLFHFRSGNLRGSRKMLESALDKLAPYPDDSLGIDLGRLKAETELYARKLAAFDRTPFAFYDLTIVITDPRLAELTQAVSAELKPNVPVQTKRQRGPKHELRGKNRT